MKKQILLSHWELNKFEEQVNRYFKMDYHVVPGTLVISTSICNFAAYTDSKGHTITKENNAFAVVLEEN